MAITTDVNVNLLNECFELRPFHGLCVPNQDDVLEPQMQMINENTDENQDPDSGILNILG